MRRWAINSFLLIGQSNMAGRGDFGVVPEIANPDILMLRDGGWTTMKEPINPDRPFSGVGLAASFADDYVKAFGGQVGLIPCAEGATSLDDWKVGGKWYARAVQQGRKARESSKLVGVLWHQGENDSVTSEAAAAYEAKFTVIMDALMKDLGLEGVPLVLGELGDFVGGYEDGKCKFFPRVNAALRHIATARPNCAIASARGLTPRVDGIHFDAPSFRELGHRYFAAYNSLRKNQCKGES